MTKILFIDGNRSFLETIAKYLSWYDYQVSAWEDSSSVLNHCLENTYDLCIFDAFCQPLNGYQLADFIKNHSNPKINQMRVLVIFEEEPPLERFVFMKKHGIYAMTKYSSIETWVEKISAIVQRSVLII